MTTLRLADIQIRDPFILTVHEQGNYYLFGSTDKDIWSGPATGFDCYRSTDLETWHGPIPAFRPPVGFWADKNYWAPEVHRYRDRFYLFATFKSDDARRGTQILSSDRPEVPYIPHSDGPVTPRDWECLDGTLHVDDALDPWILYCREWVQVGDGQVLAQRLSTDLTRTLGDPIVLFSASEAPWARGLAHPNFRDGEKFFVTDGPFIQRHQSGELSMLWSSFGDAGYAMGLARSDSGSITGPWTQNELPLWHENGGHGMIASTLDGASLLVFHQPNETPLERAVLVPLEQCDDEVRLAP